MSRARAHESSGRPSEGGVIDTDMFPPVSKSPSILGDRPRVREIGRLATDRTNTQEMITVNRPLLSQEHIIRIERGEIAPSIEICFAVRQVPDECDCVFAQIRSFDLRLGKWRRIDVMPKSQPGQKRQRERPEWRAMQSSMVFVQIPSGSTSRCRRKSGRVVGIAGLYAHYQPVGYLEEYLVEMIAVSLWRRRRVIRLESGQIIRAIECQHQLAKSESAEQLDQVGSLILVSPSRTDDLFVPGNGELDKMMRYEVMITRDLDHSMAELERLQRRRKGESVPPPIQLNISG
jgi:hypothetical protein